LLSGVTPPSSTTPSAPASCARMRRARLPPRWPRAWMARWREFCPSRWTNPADHQWPFDPAAAAEPDNKGMIRVPQDAEGTPFLPQHVVRSARGVAESCAARLDACVSPAAATGAGSSA
jgi:hypothetical protein